jgi:hypothetical protein
LAQAAKPATLNSVAVMVMLVMLVVFMMAIDGRIGTSVRQRREINEGTGQNRKHKKFFHKIIVRCSFYTNRVADCKEETL